MLHASVLLPINVCRADIFCSAQYVDYTRVQGAKQQTVRQLRH